jgi:tRNA (cytidine/uridine-2'-O-)-methyltransferase
MTLHIALIEPRRAGNAGRIARLCVDTDTPLHFIGPAGFALDDRELRRTGPRDWASLDLWLHPDWFTFRDAIARSRCLYFSPEAGRDLAEAEFGPASVLIFGNEEDGLPPRILEKHPRWCYRVPPAAGDAGLADQVALVLEAGRGAASSPRRPARPARRRR